MKRTLAVLMLCTCLPAGVISGNPTEDTEHLWSQWRGPAATGVAPHGDPPSKWNEELNIRWKTRIPGKGHATPIVWGKYIYVQTAVETDQRPSGITEQATAEPPAPERREGPPGRRREGRPGGPPEPQRVPTNIHEFRVLALDRDTGAVAWERTLCQGVPHEAGHRDASQASNSAITDGEHLYAYYGSRGLYCLDMQGELKWQKDFGEMQTRRGFGEGSSPALYGDTIVINWDHEGDSFIVALDKNTGKELWKVARDEITSWATPLVVEVDGQPQVITSAARFIQSYELATGKSLWRCSGMTQNVIPSPVYADGVLYAMSGFRGSAVLAIKLAGARGDITDTEAVLWKHDKGTPYVPSPLLYDNALYFLSVNKGIITCLDARNGQEHYGRERLPEISEVYASPVGAAGRVYVVGRDGTTVVLKHGPKFEVLANNKLDDTFDASPVIVGKELYLRGHEYLYCIASD
ncbi:MAG: PQQ-binding-like beta-propeller repeat protein [Planctomycetota bacterium]